MKYLCCHAEKRREWMLRTSNTAGLCFRPGPIYTFHFYQHLLDVSNFRLHMPVSSPDNTRVAWMFFKSLARMYLKATSSVLR